MIIGVTGLSRSGKDFFADVLVKNYGFRKITMSDVLKAALIADNKEPTKDNQSLLGDEWRKKYGNDIVMRRVLDEARKYERVIITGIRSPEEIDLAKQAGSFILVHVSADPEIRFQRRNENDAQEFGEFLKREERDIKNKGLDRVLYLANYTLENNFRAKSFLYPYIDEFARKFQL